ncbi:MAG: GDP-mannose 4,6-dehydratase [Chloroflexi bacterium]|nr:GDP-mannose 4,6-dehydratase [Chloroflexota bacterium]
MRALITGIGGFVGYHLAQYLLDHSDLDVWGLDLVEGRAASLRPRVHLQLGNALMDLQALKGLFAAISPDYVFHLAAQAFVPTSWADPWSTLENNIRGQLNVLLAALSLETYPRVLVVGSADEYGVVTRDELPVSEDNPLRPNSPYAVSKVAQDMLGYQYYASHKLPVVRVRPFNHIGPGQSPAFVTSDFARQIAEAEAGLHEPVVRVGNLEARRDFSDVHDIVRGYCLALLQGEPGEVYNLGAERSYSIQEILDGLIALSRVPIAVKPDPTRLRPSDTPEIVADCTKFRSHTGWKAEIPLECTLRDILDYWRKSISA